MNQVDSDQIMQENCVCVCMYLFIHIFFFHRPHQLPLQKVFWLKFQTRLWTITMAKGSNQNVCQTMSLPGH